MNKLKILITGSGGYIADSISKKLGSNNKFKLYGIGRSYKKNLLKTKFVQIVKGNITTQNLKKIKIIPDCIIICSGSGSAKINNSRKSYYDNVLSNDLIISNFCKKNRKMKIIFLSSAAVYEPKLSKLTENSKINPISVYGMFKNESEKKLSKLQKKLKFNLYILRIFSIYGVGLKKQIIWDAFNKFKINNAIFKGSGNEKRDLINIYDFLNVVKIILNRNFERKIDIFNVGSSFSYKIKDLVSKISKFYGNRKFTFDNVQIKKIPLSMICNNTKLKRLGWRPKKKLDEELKRYFIWFKKQK